jgi:hypothetical protein
MAVAIVQPGIGAVVDLPYAERWRTRCVSISTGIGQDRPFGSHFRLGRGAEVQFTIWRFGKLFL